MLKRLFKLVFSRFAITAASAMFQVGILLLGIYVFRSHIMAIFIVSYLLSAIVSFIIINRDSNSDYKISWLIFVFVVPVVGIVTYFLYGNPKMNKKIKRKLALSTPEPVPGGAENLPAISADYAQTFKLIENVAGSKLRAVEKIQYFPLGELWLADLSRELARAEEFILMEYYIIESGLVWEQVFTLLKAKAAAGVKIYLMYDDFGSIQKLPRGFKKKLRQAGINVKSFNPFVPRLNRFLNNRDHRKITVIDGKVGYVGGANLADEYVNLIVKHGHWKDTALKLTGPVVDELVRSFLELWNFSLKKKPQVAPLAFPVYNNAPALIAPDGYVQTFTDNPIQKLALGQRVYIDIITKAKKYIYMTTPYLIIDFEMMMALKTACARGVDVRIITPHIPDKRFVFIITRSNYLELIKAGVKIYEYTPGFMHSKSIVSDDTIGLVGTMNLDYRSFHLQFEISALLYETSALADLKADIDMCFKSSNLLKQKEVENWSWAPRALGFIFKAIAPFM